MINIILMVVLYLFFQMCFVWVIYRLTKNPSVVDVSWSLGLMVSGLIYLWSIPLTLRNIVIGVLLIIWAARLAGYLWYTRIRLGHVDKRYNEISNAWKISPSIGFFLNFQLQGLLILIISFLFYWIRSFGEASLTLMDLVAVAVVLSGVTGESVSDFQLTRSRTRQQGGVCTIGLWNYSRHPNYFFDWLTWLGFILFAIQSRHGYLGTVSLLVLYLIFTKISAPITERGSVVSRGQQYIDYQKQTSLFFPWFKKNPQRLR